jgi:hypothetical protein
MSTAEKRAAHAKYMREYRKTIPAEERSAKYRAKYLRHRTKQLARDKARRVERKYSLEGIALNSYTSIKKRVSTREHYRLKGCSFTMQEFMDWILSNPAFRAAYDAYAKSGWVFALRPSIDRIDDLRGYSLDNIQILTIRENGRKGFEYQKKTNRLPPQWRKRLEEKT